MEDINTYKVYDNILSLPEEGKIYHTFIDESFPWFFSEANSTVSGNAQEVDGDQNTKESMQFVHLFNINDGSSNSGYSNMTDWILNKFLEHTGFKLKKLWKVKANFQAQVLDFDHSKYNTPHIDRFGPHWVLLYYPNDSDGDTRIWTRKFGEGKTTYNDIASVTPKTGRFLLFKGEHYHCGAHPKDTQKRIVINYNLDLDLDETN